MTSTVTLQGVTKSFGKNDAPVLNDIDLEILPGSSTALLGPSGSGKSTILRLIAGLESPSSGRILLGNRDVTAMGAEQRGVGLVFQRPLLFPHLSVLENVAFAARAAGVPRRLALAKAQPYLDMVHLSELGDRPVRSLSGGQEQRAAIARALAAQPEVLLLDEPFSALDAELRGEMHELLADIRYQLSPTVLLVTHDRDEAVAVADRIAVLENGTLLQHDAVDRVYHRPASLAVARLMGGENFIPGVVVNGRHESALGDLALGEHTPPGHGTLVFRHEAAGLIAGHDHSPAANELRGRVSAIQRNGLRRQAVIWIGTTHVHVDVPGNLELGPDALVTIALPPAILSVVPG